MMFFAWCLSLCMWGGVGRIGGSITLMSRWLFKFATNCNQGRPSTQNLKREQKICSKVTKKILSFQYLMLLGRRKLPPTPIGRFPKTIQPCKIVNCSCLIDTKLYVKCSKSVTLMSNWLKFGEIVPFGGRSPSQPTTCPVSQCPTQVRVADICFTYSHIPMPMSMPYMCSTQLRVADICFTYSRSSFHRGDDPELLYSLVSIL